MDASQYMALLREKKSKDIGWLYLMDRYVCASDVGEWCAYCEKENDTAVITLRNEADSIKFAQVLKALHATSIAHVGLVPEEGGFRFDKLTESWCSRLVEQYPSHSGAR
jgi:hypothetical protein